MQKAVAEIRYGQKLICHKQITGMPREAYVATKDTEDEHLIKMSETWPYKYGDPHFFIHRHFIDKYWKDAKKGFQTKMF